MSWSTSSPAGGRPDAAASASHARARHPSTGRWPTVTGVLLVGGASRRFGSPKALATLRGETLAERTGLDDVRHVVPGGVGDLARHGIDLVREDA